jgi:hypothetical protein
MKKALRGIIPLSAHDARKTAAGIARETLGTSIWRRECSNRSEI